MERFLLFIRDGRNDFATLHADEASALKALAAYVEAHTSEGVRRDLANMDQAIKAYFTGERAMYAVARVAPATR